MKKFKILPFFTATAELEYFSGGTKENTENVYSLEQR